MNAVFAEKGIVLPLTSGQTVTEESRLLDGIAAQKSIFGDHIDAMRAAAPKNQKNVQDDLSAYCFCKLDGKSCFAYSCRPCKDKKGLFLCIHMLSFIQCA